MTVLFGDTNFTGYSALGASDADGAFIAAAPWVAIERGVIKSLYAYLQPTSSAQFVMALYDGQGQRLTYSQPVTVTGSGLTRFPVTPIPIKQFQAYQILLMPIAPASFLYGIDGTSFTNAYHVLGANANAPVPPYQIENQLPATFGPPAFFADGDTQAQTLVPSGKIGEHVFDIATVFGQAFRRCKIRANIISDEMLNIARSELFLLLTSDLANRGIQLFAVDIQLLNMRVGTSALPMPAGTIDVLNANYRYLLPQQVGPGTDYTAGAAPSTLKLTWAGPAVPFLVTMNGSTLFTVNPNASAGDTTVCELDGAIPNAAYSVVANPLPPGNATNTLNLSQVGWYGSSTQTPMAPYSRDDFASLSNTAFAGRPFQYWLDRQDPWPIMRLWPVPQQNDQDNACIVLWRKRQIMDLGDLSERINVPNRWLGAIVECLALRLGKAIHEVNPALLPLLKADADEALMAVRNEERENAPMRIQPQISYYTR